MKIVEPRTKIVPLGNYVLVRVHETPETTPGGLLLPESARRSMMPTLRATVIGVGPGRPSAQGAAYQPDVQPGDEVLLQVNAGVRVDHEGEELVVTSSDMLLGVVRPNLSTN